MARTAVLLIIALFIVIGGAVILAQKDAFGPTVSNDEGTRVEAPGTRVETDNDKTRIQAPGVDITVPKDDKDADR